MSGRILEAQQLLFPQTPECALLRYFLTLFLVFLRLLNDFFGDVARNFIIVGKLHGIHTASTRHGSEIRRISQEFGHWHVGFDNLIFSGAVHA